MNQNRINSSRSKTRLPACAWLASSAALALAACGGEVEESPPSDRQFDLVADGSPELERLQREVPVVENLQRAFPGAHAQMDNGHVSRLFGTILGSGATPDQAADSFRDAMITAHRAAAGDVRPVRQGRNERGTFDFLAKPEPIGLMFDAATAQYGYFLYRYAQQVTGIPVFDAELLVLVKNEPGNPVVWANNSLRNIAAFTPPRAPRALGVDGAKSLAAVQAHVLARSLAEPTPQSLDRFDPPELVIFAGAGDQDAAPRLAMAYLAESAGGLGKFRLIADASTGDILNVESLTLSLNVPGDVRGNATNSHTSAECGAETSQPMPYAEVGISGGSAGFTSQAGFFLLPNPGTTPVNVNSTLQGNYFDISNLQGANVSLTQSVTPPNQVHFLHNAADNQEFVIAQANAYFHVNKVRDFLLGYIPTYPTISAQTNFSILVNGDGTNSPGLCPGNAWYQGTNLLFCVRSSSQPNTAYGTVVDHEFGHHIVSSGGSGQGEYGEGMGDAIAALVTEQPRLGAGWDVNNCDSNLRTADNDCQFDAVNCSSCGSEIHDCGNLLSGVIWDLRQQLMISNPSNFRDLVNALTLNSIPLHTGTGIGPSIAVDFLTLDDNDGNIANGTPHGAQICAAFAAHGISCPLAPSTPCGGICSNPVVFSWTGSYQSGALGTGAVCRETTHPVAGGNCGNFSGGRTLSVNGTVMPCNNQNWSFLPPARNGGYCVSTTPGNQPWAFFTLF